MSSAFASEDGGSDSSMSDIDAKGLEKLGYKQELSRSRGLFHVLFMTLAIMSVPYGLATLIGTSLILGGPAVMIWCWIIVSILSQFNALSLAEICSVYPTSAGAYYWCYRLASPKYRLVLSWINGWLFTVGIWTVSLAVAFATGQILISGVTIFRPEWVATPWQTFFVAVTIFVSIFVLYLNKLLPALDVRPHPITNPTKIRLLAVSSMAEEVRHPATQVPQAMVWSIPLGSISGLLFLLPIVFTLPDIPTLLAVPGGQPTGPMFTLIMGSKAGGFGLLFIIFTIGLFCTISVCCAASRGTWSFARDKAIPCHHIFSRISGNASDNSSVPFNAHLLSTVIQLLLGLLYLGSSAAFNAFAGVAVICLGASYAMPIAILLFGGEGRKQMHGAPFSLGRWGWWINAVALLWLSLEIVLFSMPVAIPVNRVTM
ncbi:hypothetical protein C0993_007606, partial [Termitomyces sp. T159_Od127]